MIAAAPTWAVWLAVALSLLAVATWVVVIVVARRAWMRLRPLLAPYAALLGFPTDVPAASVEITTKVKSADPDPLDVQRAPWKQ